MFSLLFAPPREIDWEGHDMRWLELLAKMKIFMKFEISLSNIDELELERCLE